MDNQRIPAVFVPVICEKESLFTYADVGSSIWTFPPHHRCKQKHKHHHHNRHNSHHHHHNHHNNHSGSEQAQVTNENSLHNDRCGHFAAESTDSEPDTDNASEYPKVQCQETSPPQYEPYNCFKKTVNVIKYYPSEIAVETIPNHLDGPCLIIKAKHEERPERTIQSFVSRSFARRYVLPKEVDFKNVEAHLDTSTGRLTVKAPIKPFSNLLASESKPNFRRLPIMLAQNHTSYNRNQTHPVKITCDNRHVKFSQNT